MKIYVSVMRKPFRLNQWCRLTVNTQELKIEARFVEVINQVTAKVINLFLIQ